MIFNEFEFESGGHTFHCNAFAKVHQTQTKMKAFVSRRIIHIEKTGFYIFFQNHSLLILDNWFKCNDDVHAF